MLLHVPPRLAATVLRGPITGLATARCGWLQGLPGRWITQTPILKDVWGPSHVEDTHYLQILVKKWRMKLGEDAAALKYLLTEPGVGLLFIGRG